jgi:hypothetical protein
MSRHRIHIPIYALTPKLATQRKMALYRNVRPLLMDTPSDTALDQAESHLKTRHCVQRRRVCHHRPTNMLKICRAQGPQRHSVARCPTGSWRPYVYEVAITCGPSPWGHCRPAVRLAPTCW